MVCGLETNIVILNLQAGRAGQGVLCLGQVSNMLSIEIESHGLAEMTYNSGIYNLY